MRKLIAALSLLGCVLVGCVESGRTYTERERTNERVRDAESETYSLRERHDNDLREQNQRMITIESRLKALETRTKELESK